MKKDLKALIKRLTLLVQIKQAGKGWIAIDGDGAGYFFLRRPRFVPSGTSESLDAWQLTGTDPVSLMTNLDYLPLSQVCPSLTSKEALFYTDGETVWLVEVK